MTGKQADSEPGGTIAVTGAGGMLGLDVMAELARRGLPAAGFDRAGLDVTDAAAVARTLGGLAGGGGGLRAVIHCAAYTAVDRAESEPDAARRANAEAPGHVAAACAAAGARMVLVSTDYVFGGDLPAHLAYAETDPTGPLGVYGATKLAGERAALAAAPGLVAVARTSWLFGAGGPNFVATMLKLARAGRDLAVVDDQIGAPTFTGHLAAALVDLATDPGLDLAAGPAAGVFHLPASGGCSWHGLAAEAFAMSGVAPASLRPIPAAEYPTPARRPPNSRLANTRRPPLRHWREGLREYLELTGHGRGHGGGAAGGAGGAARMDATPPVHVSAP